MEITKTFLAELADEYEKNPLQKVVRQCLNQNELNKSACVQEAQQALYNQFSIDLKTLPVTNQQASGRCWIFAGLNVLREAVAKQINVEAFELSQNYVAFWDKFEKINFMMNSLVELRDKPWDDRTLCWILETGIQDGGQWDMFAAVVKKYGVVPKSAMPETWQSSHTRDMNALINRAMRKFAVQIRSMNPEAIEVYKKAQLQKFYAMLCSCFGIPPKTFDFEYVDKEHQYHLETGLDAHRFYQMYVGIDLDEYVSIIHSPTADKPYHTVFTVDYLGSVAGYPVRYLNLPLDEFKKTIIQQMKQGEVVWFGSDCGKFADRDGGTWSVEAYDFNSLFEMDFELSKEDSLNARDSAMNHAMVLTGVNLVKDKSTKWKIENSWGDDKAHKGYYVGSDGWFDRYVYQAVVHKDHLSMDACNALNTKPVHLKPWDPMGTLAD